MQSGKLTGFTQDKEGIRSYQGRICVPVGDSLRDSILEEAHKSKFMVYPGISKMYRDLKEMFWRPGMKSDIVEFVRRCLVCQKVKIEH